MRLPISNLTAIGFSNPDHIWTNSTEAKSLMDEIYEDCKADFLAEDYDEL